MSSATPKAYPVVYDAQNGLQYTFGTGFLPITTNLSGSITTSGFTQNTARLLGRTTAGVGAIEEITAGSGLTLSGGVLTATATSPNYVVNSTQTADLVTTTSTSFVDSTFGVTITPSSNTAAIRVTFPNVLDDPLTTGDLVVCYTIFRGIGGVDLGGASNKGLLIQAHPAQSNPYTDSVEVVDVPGTTSPVTYELYVRVFSGGSTPTIRINDEPTKMLAIAQEIH